MHDDAEPILQVENLHTWFFTDAGVVRAVDGVSFSLRPGETLGIVGESGSGKSVTAKSIIRLLDEPARIVEGTISFRGRDMVHLSEEELREIRGAEIAMVFQDPMTSLNPVLRISRQLDRDDDRAPAIQTARGTRHARSACCAGWASRRRNAR